MKRKYGKLALDLAMLVILLLSYSHNSINQAFHEIAGFALMGGVVLHLVLNRKWIGSVSRKFFREKLPAQVRAGYIVNFLMLCCFAVIGVSGAMISKVVFSLNGGAFWRTAHYFASALLLILLGVHLGLHAGFFASTLGRLFARLPQGARRTLAAVLTIAVIGWGCRSMVTSSFAAWLAMPFGASQMESEHGFDRGSDGDFAVGADGAAPALPASGADSSAAAQDTLPAASADSTAGTYSDGTAAPQDGSFAVKGGRHDGTGGHDGLGERGGQGLSPLRALSTLADFFSISFVFAALTQLVLLAGRRRSR